MSTSPYWNYTEFDPIRVQIQVERIDARVLERHLREQTREMRDPQAQRNRAYIIIDARDATRPPPDVRKMQAEWMEENRDLIARTCLGMSFVMPHRIVRGALTAIFWVSRPPVPYRVHANLSEAIDHAVGVCDELGVDVPEDARRGDASRRVDLAFRRTQLERVV